jgi:hypothetical protein
MPETKDKSVLLEEPKDIFETIKYTEKERTYMENLYKRIFYAKAEREKPRTEFDGLTYDQYWAENEKGANTFLKPKRDKKEIRFQSGTLREKLDAFLSTVISINLKADISAFDENDMEAQQLSTAMEDIIEKTEELENDEEKKPLRYFELLKQGDVFLEEIWEENESQQKILKQDWDGKFRVENWKIGKKEKESEAKRNILHPLSVYLGDLSKYFLEDQPFVYTVNTISYMDAKEKYGEWENFKYVARKVKTKLNTFNEDLIFGTWQMSDPPDGQVEVIKYQDVPNDEFQILLNGVPMLPLGHPLPWGKRYNIIQQHFNPIRHNFAYGKSFIFKNKNNVYLLDEMMKMGLLKTWKSFMPPMINTSPRIISESVFMPGKISMGIKRDALQPVSEDQTQGVTTPEYNMIQEMIKFIDRNTASQTFTGHEEPGRGKVTATQITELQRQARIMMGLTILSAAMLEKKLAKARTENLIQHWFNPMDTKVNQAREHLIDRYRVVSRERPIDEEGIGRRFVIPTEEERTMEDIFTEEERVKAEEGYPIRLLLVNPKILKETNYIWHFSVVPKEKKSSEMSKLMFSEMIAQAGQLGLMLNPDYLQQEFALIWDKDPQKLFVQGQQMRREPEAGEAELTGIEKPKATLNQLERSPKEAGIV